MENPNPEEVTTMKEPKLKESIIQQILTSEDERKIKNLTEVMGEFDLEVVDYLPTAQKKERRNG